jgi:hypothetical protein
MAAFLDLAGYAPVRWLRHGGADLVFKARQRSTGRPVVIRTPADADLAARRRFSRRIRLVAPLHHPNIAGLLDAGEAQGRPYAILEFVPGEALGRHLLRHGPLGLEPTRRLMGQLLDALACLHAAGVAHRDLSPGNVLITETGARPNVKLIDFGLAARIGGEGAPPAGTPGYCAPEQWRGAPPSASGDLYALGLLLVECLSGRPAALPMTMAGEPNPGTVLLPKSLRGHVLEPLLRRLLADDPGDRPFDAAALQAELAGIGAGGRVGGPIRPAARRNDAAPGQDDGLILCLSLLIAPQDGACLDPALLDALQDEEQRWCRRRIAEGGGAFVGALGDRLLFRCAAGEADDRLWRAALDFQALRAEVGRRSRLLEVRHGVRLEFRAALHAFADGPGGGLGRTAGAALRLHSRAPCGAVLASPGALRRIRRLLRQASPTGPSAIHRGRGGRAGDQRAPAHQLLDLGGGKLPPAPVADHLGAGVAAMHGGDIEVVARIDRDPLRLRAPDEQIVLAHIGVAETDPRPELLAVAQGAAADPRLASVVEVAPRPAQGRRVEEHSVETAEVGAGVKQGPHLGAKPRRRHPVVVVPVGDELAAGQLAGQVALGADA